jgi:lauroyl/myristoyl acyltransferase
VVDELYPAPPWRWSARRALVRHWLRDPALGLTDLVQHHALRLLPTDRISDIGARLGRGAGRRRPAATERARALLRALRPEADAAAIEALVAAHWAHVGRIYAEFSAFDRMIPEGRIAIEGEAIPRAILESGRPLIIAGTHVGSWETIGGALCRMRVPFGGLFQALPNRFRMAMAARQRAATQAAEAAPGSRIILPTLAAPFIAHDMLSTRQGAVLWFVDENWGGRVQAPALGRALRAEGNIARVARLAARTGAAVVPAYGLRLGEEARFVVRFLPEVPLGPPGRGKAGLVEDIAALDAAIAGPVRAHPEQWFMLNAFRPDR